MTSEDYLSCIKERAKHKEEGRLEAERKKEKSQLQKKNHLIGKRTQRSVEST